jgi:hypothetical protein
METEPGAGEMEKKTKTRRRRGGRQKEIPRSGQSETRRGERSEKRRSQHPASAAVAWEVGDGSGSLGGGRRWAATGEARWGLGLGFQSSEARVAWQAKEKRARAE